MPTEMPIRSPQVVTAVDAVERAAQIHRRNLGTPQEFEYKARRDLVTAVDRESEAVVEARISETFPDHVILGEESGQEANGTHRWIVDPLDGTTNYCHGVPHYGVSVAYERDGTLEVGVVHHTPTGETYVAVRDRGAYRNGTQLDASTTDSLTSSLVGTGFSPGVEPDDGLLEALQSVVGTTHGVRRFGCATYELTAVATGRLDGYYRTGLSPWDTAAGILLVEEAGGTVTDFEGRKENRRETVLATNGEIHDELEQLVRTSMGEDSRA